MVVQQVGVVMVKWCGGAGSVTGGVEAVAIVGDAAAAVVWRCTDGRVQARSRINTRASETDGGTGAGAESQSQSNSSSLFARNQNYALLKQQMELAGQVLHPNVPLRLQLVTTQRSI